MHTITAPPPTRLRDLLPAAPPQARLRDLVAQEVKHALLWRANHLDSELPVSGGAEQVRQLTQAIDGDEWPFTIVTTLDGGRWFQVLGTAQACVFEVGDFRSSYMVAARSGPDTPRVPLPRWCQHWVPSAAPSELFTADVAADLGLRHVRRQRIPDGFVLRPAYIQPNSRV